MSITLLIIVFIILLLLWLVIVRFFDVTLIKEVIKRINGGTLLSKQELVDAVRRFLDNRSLNIAHKCYCNTVVAIVGGNSFFSLIHGILVVESGESKYQLDLLYDNGLPVWVILMALVLTTGVYFAVLYSWSMRYKADIIASAAAIINDTFNFVPNQDWFKLKTEKAISDLGRAIDLTVNFTYEHFEEAMASTCRNNRITKVFASDIRSLYTDFSREKESLKKDIGDGDVQSIENIIMEIQSLLTKSSYDGDEPGKVLEDIDEIDKLLINKIHEKKLSYNDYKYTKIHSALGKLRERAENPWIQSISSQTFLIHGQGGCGKTHLLAKLVQARIDASLPTVLFLGKLITDTENPFSQILTILDVHCTKELFLKALDEYGKRYGCVLVVIDGLNEGRGLSLWRPHLFSFINEFKPYKNISLILSVRVNSDSNWFARFIREQQFSAYRHMGFEQNTTGAVEYMFRTFNVPLPSWPLFQRECTNPLLLTLYCRTHSGEKKPPMFEGRLQIIHNYIKHFNERLSELFSYSPQTPVLQCALASVGRELATSNNRWFIGRQTVMDLFEKTQGMPEDRGGFLDALVDEGVLNEYDYDEETSYSFGYDTIGAYLLGEALADDAPYDKLIDNHEPVLEALTDLIPQHRGKEFFELSSGNPDYSDYLVELFIKGLPFRTELTSGGIVFLRKMLEEGDFENVIRVIINNPFRTDFPLSVNTLDEILPGLSMAKRDEVWTQIISDYSNYYDPLLTLAQWGWSASPSVLSNVQHDSLRNVVHLLAWTLSTTFIELRDKASRALINILKNDSKLLLDLIRQYGSVNDPYITERIYAVAFGCCTGNASIAYVQPIAQLVYDVIFKDGIPPEHILIRDYAKCLVDFAVKLGCEFAYLPNLVSPPYSLDKKNVYVATEDILKYRIPYSEDVDKKLMTAQNNILDSMCTEYSSRGMYGDFGRYVFQSALDNWNDDIELISNFGIRMIFEEFGYDANVFSGFDGRHASWERHGNKIERIGKKYEWLALYKIAAILDDNHFGEELDRDWKTPTIYHLRRFDPTILMNPDIRDYTTSLPEYSVPEYEMSFGNDREWMLAWKKMPPIADYLDYHNQDESWICLHAYYTVSSISSDKRLYPIERELWSFVQAFLVDKEHRKEMCDLIDNEGLSGRDSSENSNSSYSYYREYYWSESYKTQIESQEYTDREYHVGRRYTLYKVQPSYLLYSISEYADASISSSREMVLPSPFLYNGLNLKFSVTDGVWLASDGSVACYDSYWVHGGHGGLFIRKDLLLKYLKDGGKSIVWPILMERMYKPSGTYWPRIQVGGYVWMDDSGKLHSKFRSYEPTLMEKKWSKLRTSFRKLQHRNKKWLVDKGLIHVSFQEHLDMLSEMDDEED